MTDNTIDGDSLVPPLRQSNLIYLRGYHNGWQDGFNAAMDKKQEREPKNIPSLLKPQAG